MTARLRPFHLLAKPAGATCNLGCQYCFFLSKENLYPARESPLVSEAVLETTIRQLMESSPGPEVEHIDEPIRIMTDLVGRGSTRTRSRRCKGLM